MNIEMHPSVKKVAEFMQEELPAEELHDAELVVMPFICKERDLTREEMDQINPGDTGAAEVCRENSAALEVMLAAG